MFKAKQQLEREKESGPKHLSEGQFPKSFFAFPLTIVNPGSSPTKSEDGSSPKSALTSEATCLERVSPTDIPLPPEEAPQQETMTEEPVVNKRPKVEPRASAHNGSDGEPDTSAGPEVRHAKKRPKKDIRERKSSARNRERRRSPNRQDEDRVERTADYMHAS